MADLSEDKKLVWLGLQNPQQDVSQVQMEIQKLKNEVGDFATFQKHLDAYDLDGDGTDDDISSYSDFKTYLLDNAFTESEADAFIEKIKLNFDSYQDFEDFIENEAESYEDVAVQFGSGTGITDGQKTEDGGSVSGLEFHDEQAVSRDGVTLPPGTVEIYGNRIEFSQTDSVVTEDALMSYSNLQVSNTTPLKYETITISADIKNIGSNAGDAFPTLTVDGEVVKSKGPIYIVNGGTDSVSFDYSFDELMSVEITIDTLSSQTVAVIPEGL